MNPILIKEYSGLFTRHFVLRVTVVPSNHLGSFFTLISRRFIVTPAAV
jgi:hypothetical protein